MKSVLLRAALLSALVLLPARAQTAPPSPRLPTLYVCGDSTAAPMRPPIQGWGQRIGEFFDPARIRVENRALGGRSARTFISEGRWAAVRSRLWPGDIVFLQFGHNDSKSAISAARYDLPGLGDETEEATDAHGGKLVIHTYGFYLKQMIDEARAAGATVVVLSPVPRCKWESGRIVRGEEGHGPAARELARREGVDFVDVNDRIALVYESIGPARSKALYFPQDNTHTAPAGARLSAACVTECLLQLSDPAVTRALRPAAAAEAARVIAAVVPAAAGARLALYLNGAYPAAGGKDVPPDAPLRLAFVAAPSLGRAGKIHIADAASGTEVETIDISQPTAMQPIGGLAPFRYYPVIIQGEEALIFPRHGRLAYGHSYVVTIDDGVFLDGTLPYSGLAADRPWRFTTRAAGPARGAPRLTVGPNGSGDFCTVQGALDSIPDGSTAPITLFVRKGIYTEIVAFAHKDNLTLIGEDRQGTVITYPNNANLNDSGGNPYADGASPDRDDVRAIYHRGVLLAHRATGFTLANLTIRNTTPHGGKQAECIIFNGTDTARAIVRDVDLYSFQDTLQVNGQAYVAGCTIEGDVDFMWGTGPSYFEHCLLRSTSPRGFYTQIRNPVGKHGFVYDRCTFEGAPGVTGNYISRIEPDRFPHSEVVLINCTLGPAVGAAGWQLQGRNPPPDAPVHFWEFNSRTPDGTPADTRGRLAASRQLREPADNALIREYSDPVAVLGHGWDPRPAASP